MRLTFWINLFFNAAATFLIFGSSESKVDILLTYELPQTVCTKIKKYIDNTDNMTVKICYCQSL